MVSAAITALILPSGVSTPRGSTRLGRGRRLFTTRATCIRRDASPPEFYEPMFVLRAILIELQRFPSVFKISWVLAPVSLAP